MASGEAAMADPQTPTRVSTVPRESREGAEVPTAQAKEMEKKKGIVSLKRGVSFNFDNSPSFKTPSYKVAKTNQADGEELIEQARQCVIQAMAKFKDAPARQNQAQELLSQFDAFRDNTPMATATAKLEKQISVLRDVVAKTTKDKRATAKANSTGSNIDKSNDSGSPAIMGANKPKTYASAAKASQGTEEAQTVPSTQDKVKWTTVKPKANRTQRKDKPCQLVLELENKKTLIEPLPFRNDLNKGFKEKGAEGPIVLSARKTAKENLVLTFANSEAKAFAIRHSDVVTSLAGIVRVLNDSTWFKVVVHGIPSAYFPLDKPEKIKEEVETYNKGLKVVGNPIWISHPSRWESHRAVSAILAFADEFQASQAVRHPLYIGGESVKVDFAVDKPKDSTKTTPPPPTTC